MWGYVGGRQKASGFQYLNMPNGTNGGAVRLPIVRKTSNIAATAAAAAAATGCEYFWQMATASWRGWGSGPRHALIPGEFYYPRNPASARYHRSSRGCYVLAWWFIFSQPFFSHPGQAAGTATPPPLEFFFVFLAGAHFEPSRARSALGSSRHGKLRPWSWPEGNCLWYGNR